MFRVLSTNYEVFSSCTLQLEENNKAKISFNKKYLINEVNCLGCEYQYVVQERWMIVRVLLFVDLLFGFYVHRFFQDVPLYFTVLLWPALQVHDGDFISRKIVEKKSMIVKTY